MKRYSSLAGKNTILNPPVERPLPTGTGTERKSEGQDEGGSGFGKKRRVDDVGLVMMSKPEDLN